MTAREVISRLKREGWEVVHKKGSHQKFRHPEKPGYVTVSNHPGDIDPRTLRSIYEQAGWEREP